MGSPLPVFPQFHILHYIYLSGARAVESIFPTPRFIPTQPLNVAHNGPDNEHESSNELLDTRSRKRRRRVADISDDEDVRPRRRAILACDVCRARRTKCDGQRPTCSFCQVCFELLITCEPGFPGPDLYDSPSTQNASTVRLRNPLQRSE
jgi:hypothetical protein